MKFNISNLQVPEPKAIRLLLIFGVLMLFGRIDTFCQKQVLQQAGALFTDGKMERSALLFDEAYQYYTKNNHLDSASLALARRASSVAFSANLTEGAKLLDQSLTLFASLQKPSFNIELDIYSEALRIYSEMGRSDTTAYFLDKSDEIINKYPDSINKKKVAMFYWNLSYSEYLTGNYPSALKTAHMAMSLFEDIFGKTSPQYGATLDWLGTLHRDLSQFQEAIDFSKQSIAIDEGDSIPTYNQAVAYNNLSGIYNRIGDYKNSLKYNDKALGLGQTLVSSGQIDKSYLLTFHSARGDTYGALNKHYESLIELKRAEADIVDNPTYYAAYLYSNIKEGYVSMDSLDQAQKYMAKTWSNYRLKGSGNRDDFSYFLALDGSLDFKLGRYDSALNKLTKAVVIRDSIFSEPEYYLATNYENLALTYCAMDSVKQASRAFHLADSISRILFNPGHQSTVSFNVNHAKCLFTHHQYTEAERLIQDAITEIGIDPKEFIVTNWSTVIMQVDILTLLATHIEFQIQKYNLSPSLEQKQYLIKATNNYIEYMQRYIGFFDSFSSHMNIEDDYFETLAAVVWVLLSDDNSHEENEFIFKCIQKSKSLISRMVLNDVSMNHFSEVPDSILKLELTLRTKLNMTANQLIDKSFVPSTTDDPFLSLEREYRELQQHLREQFPSYYALKYNFSVPTLTSLMSAIPASTIYLDYFISDSIAIAVYITHEQCILKELPTNLSSLQHDINELILAVQNVNSNDWQVAAGQLNSTLISPLAFNIEKVDQIIICLDGPMYELPMELCLSDNLFAPRPITYVTSANHIVSERQHKKDLELRVLGFAPSFTHLKKTDVLPQPFSRSLAEGIQSRFEADIYFDQDANEQAFKSHASDYPILHISTHGVLNENDPLSSYLLFYSDSLNDGQLTLNELFGMQLKSNLALLNACSTSKGKFRKGVGMNSLAAGFQYAGCRNLISSLWSIDEQANSKIIEYLYEQLEAGSSPPEALFEAKKTYLKNAPVELKHPYYWAGISLIGEPTLVQPAGFSFFYKLILAGLASICMIILIAIIAKRFER